MTGRLSSDSRLASLASRAPSLRVDVTPINMRDAGEIERTITAFARGPNGGLILTGSALSAAHGDLIVALATRHKLPAVYFTRQFVDGRGPIGCKAEEIRSG